MVKRKQVIVMFGIALLSFLVGTSTATYGGNPFDKIWEAINDLEARTESRVELAGSHKFEEPFVYFLYYYAFSGRWNISKMQAEAFTEKLNSTLNGVLLHIPSVRWDNPLSPHMNGYEYYVMVEVKEELNEVSIEKVRLLILDFLM